MTDGGMDVAMIGRNGRYGAEHALRRGWRGIAVVVLVAALGSGACSRSDDRSEDATTAMPAVNASDEGAPTDEAAAARVSAGGASAGVPGGGGAPGAGGSVAPALPQGLGNDRIVKTASLEVEVVEGGFAAAFSKVAGIAAANGGFVASSTSARSGEEGRQSSGSLVVRVPAEQFEAARQQLTDLGTLRSEQLKGEDVGGQLTDLDARLRNLRSHEEAIRILMAKTGTIGETLEVQRQLSTVREQIEQLSAEQARLQDAVAYSTITLALAEPGTTLDPAEDPSPLADALGRAVDGAEGVIAGLVVALGYLVPLALLAGAAWLLARPFVARRRRDVPVPTP